MSGPGDAQDLFALRMDPESRPRRRRAPRWRKPLIGLLVLAASLTVLRLLPLPFFRPQVETTTVQTLTPIQAHTVLTATGYTTARERAAVGAKVIGRLVELRVDEGDQVKAGDLIAVLDNADLEAAVQSAQGRLAEATAERDDAVRDEARKKAMFERGLLPRADYDAALARMERGEATVMTAQGNVASARAQASYTRIHAPIPGTVVERNVEVGEMVAPGGFTSQQSTGAIVRIANLATLEVEADVNESYIAKVRLGQPAVVKVDAVPDRPYHGTLRQVVPTGDRQRGTVEVKVTIDDRDEHLVPDMSCAVNFLEPGTRPEELEAPPRITVPRTAVTGGDGKHFVFVVENGVVHRTAVSLAEGDEDPAVVTSGLKGGETVVRAASDKLEDGRRVRVKAS